MSMGGSGMGAAIGAAVGGIHDTSNEMGRGMFSAWAQAKARSDWRKSLQRGPTYAVQGLRKAGINPLFAVRSGAMGTRPFSAMAAMPTSGRGASGALAGAQAGKMIEEQRRLMYYQVGKAIADMGHAENVKILSDVERERAHALWQKDKKIWSAHGARLRRTQLEREALGLSAGTAAGAVPNVIKFPARYPTR